MIFGRKAPALSPDTRMRFRVTIRQGEMPLQDFACTKFRLQAVHGLVPIAIGAVVLVLLAGLVNMMRGGSGNVSQKLMRLRVLLQFVAIIIIMFTIWAISK
jgi:hypothetical protein